MKSQVKEILIERAEGLISECGIVQRATSWASADAILRANSSSAPAKGGYDKHDFKVVWKDGSEYSGRYDLKHWSVERPDLRDNVKGSLQWYSGNPPNWVPQDTIDKAKKMLETLDI